MIGFGNNRRVHRLPPKMASHQYRTYRAVSPLSTHYRRATCAEVECDAFNNGWTYRKADLIRENLLYVVTHAGKRYKEMDLPVSAIRDPDTGQFVKEVERSVETCLVFEPGQVCFQAPSHRISLERPEFFYTGRGDYRTFSIRNAQKLSADDWADSFANHQDKINRAIQEG